MRMRTARGEFLNQNLSEQNRDIGRWMEKYFTVERDRVPGENTDNPGEIRRRQMGCCWDRMAQRCRRSCLRCSFEAMIAGGRSLYLPHLRLLPEAATVIFSGRGAAMRPESKNSLVPHEKGNNERQQTFCLSRHLGSRPSYLFHITPKVKKSPVSIDYGCFFARGSSSHW